MTNVYGVPEEKIKHLKDRTLVIREIRVIDPILLFQSKCHCLLALDQTDRQDQKHLRMLCLLIPEYIKELIGQTIAGRLTQRALINELRASTENSQEKPDQASPRTNRCRSDEHRPN